MCSVLISKIREKGGVMLKDLFRLKKIVNENEAMKEVFGDRDINEFVDLNEHLKKKQNELDKLNTNIENTKIKHSNIISEIEKKKKDMLVIDEALLMESFSLYDPKYDFMKSDIYKDKLTEIRKIQKELGACPRFRTSRPKQNE